MILDGFVLAGGRSTRMGADKARLPFPDGWPMATEVATVLATVCARVALVRRGPPDGLPWPRPDGAAWEVVRDADERQVHPLNGLVTACAAARTPWLVVVPCDVPFLPSEAVRRLIDAVPFGTLGRAEAAEPGAAAPLAVVAAHGEAVHPLVGVYPRALGPAAARAAAAGTSVRAFLRGARRVYLPAEWLRNVNRWEDTGRALEPLQALVAGLPWIQGPDRERLLAGEIERLATRGSVAPG